jgi:hypothetical protein
MTIDRITDISHYDYLDLGASTGGAMQFAERAFGWQKGIGIDISEQKVKQALALGRNVVCADATRLNEFVVGKCDFAIASHFLEHLPNIEVATKCLESVGTVINKWMYVQQPSFDHYDYLKSIGYALYWRNWSGHPNKITTGEWIAIINKIIRGDNFFTSALFGYGKRINTWRDSALVDFDSPKNSPQAGAIEVLGRPNIVFDIDIYREVRIFLFKSTPPDDIHRLMRSVHLEKFHWIT